MLACKTAPVSASYSRNQAQDTECTTPRLPLPRLDRRGIMTKAYYSTVFDQSADQVWSVVRDFGDYGIWVQGVDESGVEDGKSGDAVGAIRYVRMGETQIRQR